MLHLFVALSVLMSAGTILQGASTSSDVESDAAMLARMAAKGAARVFHTDSDDPIEQLIAQNSRRAHEQFSPKCAVIAQKKFIAQLASDQISPVSVFIPRADSSSELLQCFKLTHISVPGNNLSYRTLMMLTPHKDGNKLEVVMLASENNFLLEDVTLKTVLSACNILNGSIPCARLIYSIFGNTKEACQNYVDRGGNLGEGPYAHIPSYKVSDIQGSSFKFTAQTAPEEPIMIAQSLLPTYFEFDQSNDMARYLGALNTYAAHFAADMPHGVAPVLIPDVKRLQAYLARKDIPAAIIAGDREITDPARVLAATQPSVVPSIHPHEWRRGITQSPMGVVISSSVKLQDYLSNLPGIGYTEE